MSDDINDPEARGREMFRRDLAAIRRMAKKPAYVGEEEDFKPPKEKRHVSISAAQIENPGKSLWNPEPEKGTDR